jgi:hypothetical protein
MTGGTVAIGTRSTRQRAAVAQALDKLDEFRTAQEIHQDLRTAGENVGLTTVYRTLQALADSSEVDVLRNAVPEALARAGGARPRPHHTCSQPAGPLMAPQHRPLLLTVPPRRSSHLPSSWLHQGDLITPADST